MSGKAIRDARTAATRDAIVSTAERLFAEHGVAAVSHRRISDAAGLGNNTAVGYHFGSREELVRAVVRRHTERIEQLRDKMVAEVEGSAEVRDWVACIVRPFTRRLAELEAPTWFGRFGAQISTDPAYQDIMAAEALESPSLVRTMEGLNTCVPRLPAAIRLERHQMARQLMVHTVAERERALAQDGPTPRDTWEHAATGLIDVITAAWFAPTTRT